VSLLFPCSFYRLVNFLILYLISFFLSLVFIICLHHLSFSYLFSSFLLFFLLVPNVTRLWNQYVICERNYLLRCLNTQCHCMSYSYSLLLSYSFCRLQRLLSTTPTITARISLLLTQFSQSHWMYVSHSYSHFLFYSHPVDSRLLWSITFSSSNTMCHTYKGNEPLYEALTKLSVVNSKPTVSHVCDWLLYFLRVYFVSQYRSCCSNSWSFFWFFYWLEYCVVI
jgi:hypothetical protein